MGKRFISAVALCVWVFVGTGCGKLGNKETALQGTLALKLAFTEAQSPDLLSANGLSELQAPPFNAEQQAALVAEVNTVWAQCGIVFQTTEAPRSLELSSLDELRLDEASFTTNRQSITQRIGRDLNATPEYQQWFNAYTNIEAHGDLLASKLNPAAHTIPVLLLPNSGSVFAGSSFGQTFGKVDDALLRGLFDGSFKVDGGAREFSQPLVIQFGYEMHHQYLMSKREQSFTCSDNRGPGTYFNALAHEIGHFLGLSHTLPKCNLMHNDSNLITADQCATARKAAAAL